MKKALKSLGCASGASASVVDGKLILAFPQAQMPVLWQMDLSEAKASALIVQEDKGGFALALKTAKGESLSIATFDSKEQAVDGLMAAARALENAHGQIRPAANISSGAMLSGSSAPLPAERKRGWGGIVVATLIVLALAAAWGAFTAKMPADPAMLEEMAAAAGKAPAEENGVPVSADDFLNRR